MPSTESHYILLAAGSNAKGQLGIGSYDDAHSFTPCQFAGYQPDQFLGATRVNRVASIACGANHTVLLLEHLDGVISLWGTGDGRRGQLGLGHEGPGKCESDSEPSAIAQMQTPSTIFRKLRFSLPALDSESPLLESGEYVYKAIAAAWETTYVVLSRPNSSDVLLSMGSNDFGALGVGEDVELEGIRSGAPRTPGQPWVVDFSHVFPDDSSRAQSRLQTIRVSSIRAGPRHVVVQLELVVTSSGGSSYAQTTLVGWGSSRQGQLGPQTGGARYVARPIRLPVDIDNDPMISCALGNQHTVILHASGRISAFGSNKQRQIPSLGVQQRIYELGCTWNGTYMRTIKDDGHLLLSTGNNAQGQLGRGDMVGSTAAVDVVPGLPIDHTISSFVCGSEHVLVTMDGSPQEGKSVLGWGWNEHGNMGLGLSGNITVPTQLWPRRDVEVYSNGYPHKVVSIWAGCATSWLLTK